MFKAFASVFVVLLLVAPAMSQSGQRGVESAKVADIEEATAEHAGLRFPPGPADGGKLDLEHLDQLFSHTTNNALNPQPLTLIARPPLAEFSLDFRAIACGGGLETAQASGFYYLVQASSKIGVWANGTWTRLQVDALGKPVLEDAQYMNLPAPSVTPALDQLIKLATSEPLRGGRYEVRFISMPTTRGDPPFTVTAFWLKADSGRDDLIFPFSFKVYGPYWQRPNSLKLNEFISVADFLSAIRPLLKWTSDAELHDYYVSEFVSIQGAGTGRLSSHLMDARKSMLLLLNGPVAAHGANSKPGAYALDSLELVGIAMHDPPVAYYHQGTMVRINGRPGGTPSMNLNLQTHALTDFETKSLPILREGKETNSMENEDGSRMVIGAVRAQQNCLQCHTTSKVGDMLVHFPTD